MWALHKNLVTVYTGKDQRRLVWVKPCVQSFRSSSKGCRSAERWLDEPLPNWMFFSSIGRQKTAHTPPLKRFLNIAPNRATGFLRIPGCCWCGHHKKVWLQHFATVKCCEDHAITLSHPGLDVASEILIWFGFSSLW